MLGGPDLSDGELEAAERYLLLLLYAPGPRGIQGEPIRGDLWLQKELFLVSRNVEPLLEEFDQERTLLLLFGQATYGLLGLTHLAGLFERGG